ncbi:hypothetical protein HCJ93_07195 [Streptomyces sp. SBST2-5]|uniref:Secreted protein n=1 Tax=Streptomyces composti TaxID=2720025 RepID=A0ABX1A0C9_9ACTN|nr:hypothetical protein [Streptomyces composti]NJP49863.1 hypothetical protein [Streptomyces composti]
MAVLAALIPLLMLGVLLMLGRYEELMMPLPGEDDGGRRTEPAAAPRAPAPATPAALPPPAGTPAPSP